MPFFPRALVCMSVLIAGCLTPAELQLVERAALDIGNIACITAKADLPDDKAVATACGIAEALLPALRIVLEDFRAKRSAYAKTYAAQRCGQP